MTTPPRPLVVLLHGLARGHGSMAHLGRVLRAAGHDTVSRTYPSRRHSIRSLAEEVAEWIVAEAAGRPVAAVTHSMGGVIALTFYFKYPARVRGTCYPGWSCCSIK